MATKTFRVDDLDGTEVDIPTTVLALNGRKVSIDLSADNLAKLEKYLAKYFDNGIVSEARNGAVKVANADEQDRNAEIRTWAIANGHVVKERGRLPGAVVQAFEEWEASQDGAETPAA